MTQQDTGYVFDPNDFSEVELELEAEFESRYIKPPKTREIPENFLKYADAKKLAKNVVIDKDSRYFVVVNGSFYFGDFIEGLVVENNWHVKKMTISTLSLNQNNVDSLGNLLRGGFVDELNLIISDYFFSHERQGLIPYIYEVLDVDDKFQLAVAGSHCKICIMETHCGMKVAIHGSANLRSSSNIEQIVIEENQDLYDFNDEYQGRIIETYKTINKSLRRNTLWHQVQTEAEKAAG